MRHTFVVTTIVALSLSFVEPCARAASHDELNLDPASISQLEQRAEHAETREQAFLYTQLVHVYITLAGKQLAAGDTDDANVSLKHVQHFTQMIHAALVKNAKKLKDSEMLLQAAAFRLGQCMGMVSSDDKPVVEATLHQLNGVNDEMLAQVFSH
jgi:hypothetical protein